MKKYECTPDMRMRLFLIREALGLSQRAMGRKMGLSYAFYGKLETRDKEITENSVVTICSVFHVRPEYLLQGELPMFNDQVASAQRILKCYGEMTEPYRRCLLEYSEFLYAKNNAEKKKTAIDKIQGQEE